MMFKIFAMMSLISMIFGCQGQKESTFFGYNLPIKPLETPSTYYLGQFYPNDGVAEFIVRDGNSNHEKMEHDGVAAIDLTSQKLLWHTPFTTKIRVAPSDTILSYFNILEGITYNDGNLFCLYRQVAKIKPQHRNEETRNIYNYLYLDSETGKVLKQDIMDLDGQQLLFIGNNIISKNTKTKTTNRLNPNTGEYIWTYQDVFPTHNNRSNANDKTISFYRAINSTDWQIVVLDWGTGQPIFSKTLTNMPKHKIDQVICHDGKVYVDLGAVYYENPLSVIKEYYKVYQVVFDQKSQEPLWRTNFYDEKR